MTSSIARKFVPMMDRVLVQKLKPELKSAGGVFLPESGSGLGNQLAKVVSVGSGKLLKDGNVLPCSVKLGDTVLVPEFGGMKLKLYEEECFVYRDEDIVGVVNMTS